MGEAAGGYQAERLLRASGGLCGWSGGQDEPLRTGSRLERVTRCQRGDGAPTHRKPPSTQPKGLSIPSPPPPREVPQAVCVSCLLGAQEEQTIEE